MKRKEPKSSFFLLFRSAKLPECNGAGSGNIQGIDPVLHGNAYRIVTGPDGFRQQAVTFRAEKDSKPRFPVEIRIIDVDGIGTQRHGGGGKAMLPEKSRNIAFAAGKECPRNLKYSSHADPDGSAVKRIAAVR